MISRRRILGGIVSTAGAIGAGSLPKAIDSATLEANVTVREAWPDPTGDIGHLRVEVDNQRPPTGEPITVVGNVWGVQRMTQVPWNVERDHWPVVQPGQTKSVHFIAPGTEEDVRLMPDKRAMIRIYDRGTEERAHDTFVPSEVDG